MKKHPLIFLASWFAYAGAVVSVVQIGLLVLFFILGEPYGHLNDAVVIVQYLLAFPLMLALHQLLSYRAPVLSAIALVLGVVGMFAIAILQILLVIGTLSFSQEVGPVTVALFVPFGGWMLLTGYLSWSQLLMPRSIAMSVAGWTYGGYPFWAFWLGRQLGAIGRRQALSSSTRSDL